MAQYTVIELIERAQAAADMHDNFVTTTQWLRWLNVEYRALTLFILRSGYVVAQSKATITANGSLAYNLTSDPMVVLGVYELRDGRYRRLKHSDMMDGAGFIDNVTTGAADIFRIYDDTRSSGFLKLQLWPVPQSGTYEVYTVDIPATLALGDSVNLPAGFEERLVLGLARRALAKEESNTAEIRQQIAESEQYIESVCWDRVMAGHQQIRNVDKVERGWLSLPQLNSRERWYWVS